MPILRKRHRRLRRQPWLRDLVQEHRLDVSDLVWPVFVQEGDRLTTPVEGLPGVERYSIDRLVTACKQAHALGIRAVAVFPAVPENKKTEDACEACNPENLACRAIQSLKDALPEMGVIADVALDPYTSHGHDGVLDASADVDNDATVALLAKQAVVLAQAGADVVAPSDMMDGRVLAIRDALDGDGLHKTAILSYAAKYASAFYGPFRTAVGSKKALGAADKRSYQMQSANRIEALSEVAQDISEGADMVMVKPGIHYLDVLADVAAHADVPVCAYHVSGEYAMLCAAEDAGLLDGDAALMETMLAFKRAGARFILTYGALRLAHILHG
jgi:porphobilinogen synthase